MNSCFRPDHPGVRQRAASRNEYGRVAASSNSAWPPPATHTVAKAMRSNTRPTKPEVALRSALHRRGLRFRSSLRLELVGRWTKPDIVFTRSKVTIFLDGCFWHFCPQHGSIPRSNAELWIEKLQGNVERDRNTDMQLEALGWTVVRGWEHEPCEQIVERVVQALIAAGTQQLGAFKHGRVASSEPASLIRDAIDHQPPGRARAPFAANEVVGSRHIG